MAAALALWILGTTVVIILTGHRSLPFWDEWERWITWLQDGYTPRWFFAQHNEHRLVLPKLLYMADHLLFGARNWFLLGCSFLLQGATGLLLWRFLRRICTPDRSEAVVLGAAIVACLYSARQEVNFTWAFQVPFILVYCLAVAAFLALLRSEEQRRKTGGGRAALATTIALAAGGTYTMANGILLWPVLLLAAAWWRLPARRIGTIAAGALLLGAPFFYHWTGSGEPEEPMTPLLRVARSGLFLITHIGAPVDAVMEATGSDLWRLLAAGIVGAALLAGTAVAFVRIWRHRDPRQGAQAMLLHVCAFLTATSCAVALGRADFSTTYAFSSRYFTPAYLFWLCLLLAAWPSLRRMPRTALYSAICVALAGGIAIQQIPTLHRVIVRLGNFHRYSMTVVTGVFDPQSWDEIYYEPEEALPAAAWLRDQRLGLFAEAWTHWIGQPIAGRLRIAGGGCRGSWDSSVRLQSGWRATGRAQPGLIVFVTGEGKIAGLGRTGSAAEWLGYIRGTPGPVNAYLLPAGEDWLCPIGSRDLR